jgi:hypothetical protein
MESDQFAERIAGVRKRFAAKLAGRIAEIDAALPQLTCESATVATAVYETHRKVHDLCGIGPTLGFNATGTAARQIERILLQPSRAARALTEREIEDLKEGLLTLRAAAQTDMQSVHAKPE